MRTVRLDDIRRQEEMIARLSGVSWCRARRILRSLGEDAILRSQGFVRCLKCVSRDLEYISYRVNGSKAVFCSKCIESGVYKPILKRLTGSPEVITDYEVLDEQS